MSKTVVAVIGCGNIARAHMWALKNGEGIEVVLTSHTGQDRGSVKITGATASNVRVRSSVADDAAQIGSNSATVVVGLEWGEF